VVEELLEAAMRKAKPQTGFYLFLESLQQWFTERGYLTPAQFAALRKAAS
jgi:hypothetical protein